MPGFRLTSSRRNSLCEGTNSVSLEAENAYIALTQKHKAIQYQYGTFELGQEPPNIEKEGSEF
jgi:hypothetical protein